MSPHMQELIAHYGYWLMLLGALIEGETFLIAGGIAAHQGLLHLPGLLVLAVVGSLIHDHVFFYIGRFTRFEVLLWSYKKKLSSYRKFKKKINKRLTMLERYGVILIIGFRFMYGLRTIVPIIIGLSPITKTKFFLLDLLGALIWSCIFIYGGYFFGSAVTNALQIIHDKYKISWLAIILIALITIIVLLTLYFVIKSKIKKAKSKN